MADTPNSSPKRSPACPTLTMLWNSITWQCLSDDERVAIRYGTDTIVRQADNRSPLVHFTLEPAWQRC
ncbi:hypothetical protein [Mycobacterium uberis]|uniref:hypothetical protein n=1 Tax=Mycobacterium uberis TaxID=2162698 RepID=UPI001403CA67|nr:hypothetical protein [Mycobacterium uberis]